MWSDPVVYGAREFVPDIIWDIPNPSLKILQKILPDSILNLLPCSEFRDILNQFSQDPSKTSFGYVSMQLGVAANMIGIEPEDLNYLTEWWLSQVLSDPEMSIMFAAKHLAQLKNIDYPDIPSRELTLNEMKVIANRYNMGSSLSLDEIEQYDYGIRFWERLADMDKLLYPDKG